MAKPDLTINSIPLHKGQRLFVDKVLSHENRNVFYWACVTPRQYGKTTLITQMMTYYAVTDPGSHCFYAAPTYSLSKKQFKFILKGLKDTGLVKSSDASDYIIELTNGSTLSFKSVAVPENLRGDSVTYMFLDEFALYKEEVFTAILKPMLSVRGKKCFMLSTPRGKNYFYKLYKWGLDDSMYRYGSFRGDASLNPFANRDEIEDARKTLPDLACPALVMWGDSDQLTPPDANREIADLLPHAQRVEIAQCGHMLTMEQPDQVNTHLLRWLESLRAPTR